MRGKPREEMRGKSREKFNPRNKTVAFKEAKAASRFNIRTEDATAHFEHRISTNSKAHSPRKNCLGLQRMVVNFRYQPKLKMPIKADGASFGGIS